MSDLEDYTPPQKWVWDKENGGKFANINRPVSGSTHQKKLPIGKHPFQLYSQGTPNVDINPNSKIPSLVDNSGTESIKIFESGSILLYLADKFQKFIPQSFNARTECLNWLFWQMASAPYLGGGFGHFYAYAPKKFEYPIDRFSMEVKRQLDVLDKLLSDRTYVCNDDYTIADIAIWSWYGALVLGRLYGAKEFLDVKSYKNVVRWANLIDERPAVKRGRIVNKTSGDLSEQLHERHSSKDFDDKTEDKLKN